MLQPMDRMWKREAQRNKYGKSYPIIPKKKIRLLGLYKHKLKSQKAISEKDGIQLVNHWVANLSADQRNPEAPRSRKSSGMK